MNLSSTITEKQLYPDTSQGKYFPEVKHDILATLSINAQTNEEQGNLLFKTLSKELNKGRTVKDNIERKNKTTLDKTKIFLDHTNNINISFEYTNMRNLLKDLVAIIEDNNNKNK